jgi:hypothetical protein
MMSAGTTIAFEFGERMRARLIQQLATTALILTIGNFGYAYTAWHRFDETTVDLLSFSGFNAIVIPSPWLFETYYVVQVISLLGLLTRLEISKYVFLANIVLFAATGLLTGISVSLPIEVFVATLIAYIYGAIVLLLFFPSRLAND